MTFEATMSVAPILDEDQVYVTLPDGIVQAHRLLTGRLAWAAPFNPVVPATTGDGFLYLAEADSVAAIDRDSGQVRWRLPLTAKPSCRPVWDEGWLLIALETGDLVALNARDGTIIWKQSLGSTLHAPPTVAADRIVASLSDGRVVALSRTDGSPGWERRLGGPAGEILALGDRLFVGSLDNFFYCLDARDGVEHWRWRAGADVIGRPATDGHSIYFVALDNVLRALNPASGVQRWKQAISLRPHAGPITIGDTVIASGIAPTLKAFLKTDGTPLGEHRLAGDLAAPPVLVPRRVTLGFPLLILSRSPTGTNLQLCTKSVDPPLVPLTVLPGIMTTDY